MVKTKKSKLLAVTVALSMILSNVITVEGRAPACLPENSLTALEELVKGDKGKIKSKKGYCA